MSAKVSPKASATSPNVDQPNEPPPLSDMLKAAPDTTKVVARNVENGKLMATAPVKPSPKAARIKVKKYSYKMPKSEHDAIIALKEKLNEQGIKVKKSELIRAGLQIFVGFSEARIKASLKKISAGTVRVKKPN